MSSLFDSLYPPDSGISVYFVKERNIWIDDDGKEHLDLKEFGFTALQRNTLRNHIQSHWGDEYVSITNNYGDLIEIYWGRNLEHMQFTKGEI